MKYVVAMGNPFDGISLHGPFDSREDAETWAEDADGDWWVHDIVPPDEEDVVCRHTVCKYCGLDVEGFSPFNEVTEWRDRGNNTECPNKGGRGMRRHEGVL